MAKQPKPHHLQRGQQAEEAAETYLADQGLTPVARNYRCRCGELDLIMRKQNLLIIVEVRSRRHSHFGSPVETVGFSKQRKIMAAAQYYLQENKLSEAVAVRFDVVSMIPAQAGQWQIQWIENAFQRQW